MMQCVYVCVQILERRAEQRRNWFRKQREFLLQARLYSVKDRVDIGSLI